MLHVAIHKSEIPKRIKKTCNHNLNVSIINRNGDFTHRTAQSMYDRQPYALLKVLLLHLHSDIYIPEG